MEHPNIYTFRHSALPPIDNAMKGEIAEIDFNVSNLILKFQGHYRALSELRETLSDLLDSCELNLQSIRIVPDSDGEEEAPRAIGLTDLPLREKAAIAFEILKKRVATKLLAEAYTCSTKEALAKVRDYGEMDLDQLSEQDIDEMIFAFSKNLKETGYTEEAETSG